MKWAILGVGDVARRRVAGAIHEDPGSELVGACRRNRKELEAFAAEFRVPRAYDEEALYSDADVDAVYIATPPSDHEAQTIAAARAGKHVLVEKPMALTEAQCRAMVDACREHGVTLGVAYYRRFYPVWSRLRDLVRNGTLGEPLSIRCATSSNFGLRPSEEGFWRVQPDRSGGGALMDVGSHRLDLFLDLFGDPADVFGQCDTIAGAFDGDDCSTVTLRFPSGVHGSLQCFFGGAADPDELGVIGTRGSAFVRPLNGGELLLDVDGTRSVEQHSPAKNFNTPLIEDFRRAVEEGREPTVTGIDGQRVQGVIDRAYGRR
ncbi:MAG: Gfo/Idh/MocA family oxidoreductase [Planctomycetota bacterium]